MRKKWIFITAICVGLIMLTTVATVLIFNFKHKHKLNDAKVYHIYNDRIYYTMQCEKSDYIQSFETNLSFAEVVNSLDAKDKIVIEENITMSQIVRVRGYETKSGLVSKKAVVNIDLNNKEIHSMFNIDATYGSVKFNIYNGVIKSDYQNAIKATGETGEIEVNITDVECSSVGYKNAPLYIENIYKAAVSASDSKFVASKESSYDSYGVGVFINCEGDFKFENCLLEGGDGLHVRQGTISLKGCDLVNSGLPTQASVSHATGFSAVGASLVATCYTSSTGTTNFEISIENCSMITNNSNRVIYVDKTAKEGYSSSINTDSVIEILSCKFDENPTEFGTFDRVRYVNGGIPVNNGQGYWIYGSVTK